MHEIGKQIDFCYGHRVWSQELQEGYSEDMCLACRHLHGHQGTIIVYLKTLGQDKGKLVNGMVTDFKHLGWFKRWVDGVLDHKFIIDKSDPLFNTLFTHMSWTDEKSFDDRFTLHSEGYWTPNLDHPNLADVPGCVIELYEGLIVVPFVPTSENLSKWVHKVVNNRMNKIGVECSRIQFFETPKSQANYIQ
jgi:6-pyruvoyltetrahydropterin/6-carboxytetrahydropterin synthase